MNDSDKPLTVFYDGACPRCVRDRANYERLAGEGAIGRTSGRRPVAAGRTTPRPRRSVSDRVSDQRR